MNNIEVKKLSEKEKIKFKKLYNDAEIKKTNDFYALIDKNSYIGGLIVDHKFKFYSNLKPEVFISFFYVSPKYRGMKLGVKLFNIILNKYNKIELATENRMDNSNKLAIDWYTRIGFKQIHKEKEATYWCLEKLKN